MAAKAADLNLDGLVVVAPEPEATAMQRAAATLKRVVVVPTPEAAAPPLQNWLQPDDVLLLKASRGVALERLMPLLPNL